VTAPFAKSVHCDATEERPRMLFQLGYHWQQTMNANDLIKISAMVAPQASEEFPPPPDGMGQQYYGGMPLATATAASNGAYEVLPAKPVTIPSQGMAATVIPEIVGAAEAALNVTTPFAEHANETLIVVPYIPFANVVPVHAPTQAMKPEMQIVGPTIIPEIVGQDEMTASGCTHGVTVGNAANSTSSNNFTNSTNLQSSADKSDDLENSTRSKKSTDSTKLKVSNSSANSTMSNTSIDSKDSTASARSKNSTTLKDAPHATNLTNPKTSVSGKVLDTTTNSSANASDANGDTYTTAPPVAEVKAPTAANQLSGGILRSAIEAVAASRSGAEVDLKASRSAKAKMKADSANSVEDLAGLLRHLADE